MTLITPRCTCLLVFLIALPICTAATAPSFAATVYDEAVSGDANPNFLFEGLLFQLKPGANIFRGTVSATVEGPLRSVTDRDGYFFTFPYHEQLIGGEVVFSGATKTGDIGFAPSVRVERTTPTGGYLGLAYQTPNAVIFDVNGIFLGYYGAEGGYIPYNPGYILTLSSSGSSENNAGGGYYRASIDSSVALGANAVSASADYELTLYLAARSITPIVINSNGDVEFDGTFGQQGELLNLAGLPGDQSAVGEIAEVIGSVMIIREDGTVVTNATIGTPVYTGDVVETESTGATNIRFVDETSFAISENARLTIDDYVYSPHVDEGTTDFSIFKGIFVYTSKLIHYIGGTDPDDDDVYQPEIPTGSIGIRGGLDDIEQADPVTGEPFRTASSNEVAMFQASSPVTLYTAVQVPDEATSLSFDFAFFDDSASSIEVMLGEVLLGVVDAASLPLGTYWKAEFDLIDKLYEAGLSYELALTYNGETGSQAIVDNFAFGGSSTIAINNGDFSQLDNGWFARGDGKVLLGAVVVVAVPEPSTILLAGFGGIALLSMARRRSQARR